jgi:cytochrome bd ubiquinol oxidase subunit I
MPDLAEGPLRSAGITPAAAVATKSGSHHHGH